MSISSTKGSSSWRISKQAKQPLPQNRTSKNSKWTLEAKNERFSRTLNWNSRPWTETDFKESPTAILQEFLQDLAINIELNEELKYKKKVSIHWHSTSSSTYWLSLCLNLLSLHLSCIVQFVFKENYRVEESTLPSLVEKFDLWLGT